MNAASLNPSSEPSFDLAALNAILAKYKESHLPSSLWQIANTAIPFFSVMALMYLTAYRGYWPVTLPSPANTERSARGSFPRSLRAS